jgi:hypothetical protein
MLSTHRDLEFLVHLDGVALRYGTGHVVKTTARPVVATQTRLRGVKCSLTLHDPTGRLIYGIDNAHETGRGPNMTIASAPRQESQARHLSRSGGVVWRFSTPRFGG